MTEEEDDKVRATNDIVYEAIDEAVTAIDIAADPDVLSAAEALAFYQGVGAHCDRMAAALKNEAPPL